MARGDLQPDWEDATRVDGVLSSLRDGGHVLLSGMKIEFVAQAPSEAWRGFISQTGLPTVPISVIVGDIYALPPQVKQLDPYLVGGFQSDLERPEELHWELELVRAPNVEPPSEYREKSERIGGFPGVLERMATAWPIKTPITARVDARYIFLNREWEFPVSALLAGSPRGGSHLEPISWRVVPKRSALERIDVKRIPGSFELTGSGTVSTHFSARLLNELDRAIWTSLRKFVRPRVTRAKRRGRITKSR